MEVQLGKLFSKLVNGGTPSTGVASYWGGSIPWVTGADFTSRGIGEIRRYVSESGVRSSSTSVVDPGNLLVVTRTGVGKLAIAKEPIAISQDITGVYPDLTKTDTLFLYFLLVKELEELKKLNQGTSINGIIRSDFEKHLVKIPAEIHVQQKIAGILQAIDQTIEKTETLIEKYQHIKAGMMHDLFTRGIGSDGKLRPPREQAPELYRQTPIGWLPKEWNLTSLKDLNKSPIRDFGSFSSTNLITFLEEGIPFIKSEMIKEEEVDWSTVSFVSKNVHQLLSKSYVRGGQILFSKIGSALGKAVFYDGERGECNSNAAVAKIEVDENVVVPQFVEIFLNSVFARTQFQLMIISLLPRINLGDINKLLIQVPKIEEQKSICVRYDSLKIKINSEKKLLAKLKKQKSGLMHDLLTGKVSVRVDESELETA